MSVQFRLMILKDPFTAPLLLCLEAPQNTGREYETWLHHKTCTAEDTNISDVVSRWLPRVVL